ncbi:MAG TPA: nuclear transport factor 2 family protein [Acidimicrobiales bacterium]|nr:nuclear transport factor 2 family protein [Acidimicrobiales bacterium]
MSPAAVVRALWERMEDRDWDGARATLADGYTCDYPATGERFASADAFIAMNRAYPEGWAITVDETVAEGPRVVARVRVAQDDHLFHCLSFADVDGDRITRSTDFWLDDGGDPSPDWRAPYRVPPEEQH